MKSTSEKETEIVQNFINNSVKELELGEPVYVSGGYICSGEKAVLDRHCNTIVENLISKGFTYTTNHGYGCLDYKFYKKLKI